MYLDFTIILSKRRASKIIEKEHDNFCIYYTKRWSMSFETVAIFHASSGDKREISMEISRNRTQCKQLKHSTKLSAILLVKVQVGQEMIHQRPHVFFISKRQEWDYTHHSLKHTAVCPLQ